MSASDGTPIVLSVCVSCQTVGEAGSGEAGSARPGERLLARLRDDVLGDGSLTIRPVQCLSVCKRPCTVALSSPGRYTYLFGDLDPETGADALLTCVASYRQQEHGYLLWRERPEPLRRGILARVPPVGWDGEDGRHPR
jgi:predicted metal-binding protein